MTDFNVETLAGLGPREFARPVRATPTGIDVHETVSSQDDLAPAATIANLFDIPKA